MAKLYQGLLGALSCAVVCAGCGFPFQETTVTATPAAKQPESTVTVTPPAPTVTVIKTQQKSAPKVNVPSGYVVWRGTGQQIAQNGNSAYNRTYPVVMYLNNGALSTKGLVSYPSLGCSGVLSGSNTEMRERITRGNCDNNGIWYFDAGTNSIDAYYDVPGSAYRVEVVLYR